MKHNVALLGTLFAAASVPVLIGAAAKSSAPPLALIQSKLAALNAEGGKLHYTPYDPDGDVLPDFSVCGYKGGGVALPNAPVKKTLAPQKGGGGDDTVRIQAALDEVGALPLNERSEVSGLRGTVLLQAGTFRVGGPLLIKASGVVLRGMGPGPNGTLLLATGKKPYSLVTISGGNFKQVASEQERKITDAYVPVGARMATINNAVGLHAGMSIIVRREGNADFIHTLGMDKIVPRASDPASTLQWKPFTLFFDRLVTKIEGNTVTWDAPIACAIDTKWGGGSLALATDTRIENVGVENLRAESLFDKTITAKDKNKIYLSDENHAEYIVRFEHVRDGWAKNLSARYLAQGVALMGRDAQCITVQDAQAVDPVSVITGGRRYTFSISGQQCLVQRCYARDARHAFIIAGGQTCGPNVFLNCVAENNHATSEPHQRWSVGGLYDNVNADMAFQDRQWMGSGHGWAGANFVAWNCKGSLVCQKPPTAQNFAIGFVGKKDKGAFVRPDGWWEFVGLPVSPRSLYEQQLKDRLGEAAVKNTQAAPGNALPPLPPPYQEATGK